MATTILYAANSIFLGLVGAIMFLRPQILFPGADPLTVAAVRSVGVGDLTVAALTGILLAHHAGREPTVLSALVVFHFGLTAVQVVTRGTVFSKPPVLVTHGLFGIASLLALLAVGPFA